MWFHVNTDTHSDPHSDAYSDTNAAAIMIGEKTSDLILADA